MESLAQLLPLLLIVLVFYLFIIRPARNRQRAAMELLQRLAPGQEVMTTAGLYGTLVAVEDDTVTLETSPGVTTRWAKPAVARIVTDPAGPASDPADPDRTAG